jgi:YHS domain-containing protein
MNRCITCGKIVTGSAAGNVLTRNGQSYLVCCPLCEEEFERNPEHYLAVSKSVLGMYAGGSESDDNRYAADYEFGVHPKTVHMMKNLKESYADIERSYKELVRHFDELSTTGGLEGLRNALRDHRGMMEALQDKMAVHEGVCNFVLSIAESSANTQVGAHTPTTRN